MKKIFSICLLSICAAGFTASAQTSIGVHGSFISSNLKFKSDEPSLEFDSYTKSRSSFRAGVAAIIPVGETFAFMPQLNFVSAGTKLKGSASFTEGGITSKVTIKGSIKPSFIEVPLHLGIAKTMDDGSRFFAGVGPSLEAGIGGKYEATTVTEVTGTPAETETVKGKIRFDGKKSSEATDDDPHFKRLTFAGSAIAGYQLPSGLFIQANYNHGFTSLSPDKGENIKSYYFGIGIGYFFGGSK